FKAVVDSFVANIITPLIAAIGGKQDFGQYYWTIHHSRFLYGQFVSDVISFLIIAASIFVVVKAFETLQRMRRPDAAEDAAEPLTKGEELLTEIRDLLRRQAR